MKISQVASIFLTIIRGWEHAINMLMKDYDT